MTAFCFGQVIFVVAPEGWLKAADVDVGPEEETPDDALQVLVWPEHSPYSGWQPTPQCASSLPPVYMKVVSI